MPDSIEIIATLVGLLLGAWPFLRTLLNARQVARIERVARIVVQATEVYMRDTHSEAKLTYARRRAQEVSKKYNVKLTDDQWEVHINNAVYELKRVDGELPKAGQTAYPNESLR